MDEEARIMGELGKEVISDEFPSFFVVQPYHQQWVDIGWIDVPGLIKWQYSNSRDGDYVRASLRALIASMAGRYTDEFMIDQLVTMTETLMRQAVKTKKIVPMAEDGLSPRDKARFLVKSYLPRSVPMSCFKRCFGDEADSIVDDLMRVGVFVGREYIKGMQFLIPVSSEEAYDGPGVGEG